MPFLQSVVVDVYSCIFQIWRKQRHTSVYWNKVKGHINNGIFKKRKIAYQHLPCIISNIIWLRKQIMKFLSNTRKNATTNILSTFVTSYLHNLFSFCKFHFSPFSLILWLCTEYSGPKLNRRLNIDRHMDRQVEGGRGRQGRGEAGWEADIDV